MPGITSREGLVKELARLCPALVSAGLTASLLGAGTIPLGADNVKIITTYEGHVCTYRTLRCASTWCPSWLRSRPPSQMEKASWRGLPHPVSLPIWPKTVRMIAKSVDEKKA